ncbi:hypothetical protein K504DRAFT_504087 [Pleomassaria siparia CBS 279.74]|uniref:Rhodopsin domain-containing protein n=1 Tax=Pleomassaria siparia CBS 279.74 TaxID=1314801 RepID=A0A6G1K535_9PLEO|nr:hypothetical protein K504DRAFT_504087 [Pleomassaria siparia CBS 279.74]
MFAPWDLGPTVEIAAYSLTGFSTAVVAVRFYCRFWVVGKLKNYDYIMFAALISTWGLCVVNHFQLKFGTGQHAKAESVPPEVTRTLLLGAARSWYAYQMVYILALTLVKFSILLFYLTIATQRTFRVLTMISIAVVAITSITMITLNAFECPKHPSFALTPGIFTSREENGCIALDTLYFSQAGVNIFTDTAILILPMPILVKLRMPRLKRFSLLAVFGVGLLVPIASGLRIWSLWLWTRSGALSRYNGGYILFFGQVEINTAIVCASAPSLQPLFRRIFGELSRFQRTHSPYYYYGGHRTITEIHQGQIRPAADFDPVSVLITPDSAYLPVKRFMRD